MEDVEAVKATAPVNLEAILSLPVTVDPETPGEPTSTPTKARTLFDRLQTIRGEMEDASNQVAPGPFAQQIVDALAEADKWVLEAWRVLEEAEKVEREWAQGQSA